MAPFSSTHPLRRTARGGISWVTLLILLGLAGTVYAAIMWGPVYVVHYGVRQVVRDYMNQAIKNRDDAAQIEAFCARVRSLDTTPVARPDGSIEKVPAVDLTPEMVTWERDAEAKPPTLRIAFEYTREVRYPFMDRVTEWTGAVDITADISIPDWGPSR